jgi:hypothetical protein
MKNCFGAEKIKLITFFRSGGNRVIGKYVGGASTCSLSKSFVIDQHK